MVPEKHGADLYPVFHEDTESDRGMRGSSPMEPLPKGLLLIAVLADPLSGHSG